MNELIGKNLDHFLIQNRIGRGGMAEVYLAQDVNLKRHAALKMLLPELSRDKTAVNRFRREAETMARLQHPNIVQVYSTGQTEWGQPYMAMQYISGGSLHDKLEELTKRGKLLTTEQTLNLTRQLVDALRVAHRAKVIHRDLKPSNILIRPEGTPMLVDLGIVAVSGGTKLTRTRSVIGTPAYMSPEQILGQPLDSRSDLYSLGIILYELFAGQRPFDAENPTTILYKQVHEQPIPLRQIRPDLSPKTLAIVEKLLHKEPADRYESAEMLATVLDQAIQTEVGAGPNPHATHILTHLDEGSLISRDKILPSISHLPGKTVESMLQFAKQLPLWIIATLLILVTAITVFAFWSPEDESTSNSVDNDIPIASSRITPVLSLTEAEEGLITEQAATSTVAPLPTPTEMVELSTRTAIPEDSVQTTPPVSQDDWRFGTLTYLVSQNGGRVLHTLDLENNGEAELLYMPPSDRNVQGSLWSPNGESVILYDTLGRLYFVEGDTGQVSFGSHECTAPAWSPDGSQIICRAPDSSTFDIVDVSTGELIRQIPRPNGATLPHWSPEQDEIVFAVFDAVQTSIWRMSLNDLAPVLLADNNTENYAPVWSPNGEWIAYQSNDESDLSEIWIMDSSGGNPQRLTMTSQGKWSRAPFWSPDGQYIAFVSDQAGSDQSEHGEIFIVSVVTGEVYQVTETGGRVYNWRVSWKP